VGGTRLATSVGSEAIGRRGSIIVGDDLQSDKQSAHDWQLAWDFWTGTLSTRAENPSTVAKMVVQQRLGKGDISDRILEYGGYTHLKIPNEYDPRRSCVTVVGGKELWRDPRTEEGELLNPRCAPVEVARKDAADACSASTGVGPHKYKAQYNQDPDEVQGKEYLRTEWRFYRHPNYAGTHRPAGCVTAEEFPAVPLPRDIVKSSSMDTALKDKETSDWTVCGAIGQKDAYVYVLDVLRAKVKINDMPKLLESLLARNPGIGQKFIEDKVSGTSLYQLLSPIVPGLKAIDPGSRSKPERARLHVLPRQAANQIFLPEGAPWTDEFVAEFSKFPGGTNDDQVDMLTLACMMLPKHGKNPLYQW
jgi:predicted phage terminase large subunit-like protein